VDLVRDYGPVVGMKVLDWIEDKGDNIVAIDIGGSEHAFPPDLYVDVYRRAKEMGLRLVAHAGEAAGPDSVLGAIEKLGVERIGHGLTASKDPSVLDLLKKKKISIETCPISNLRTGAIGKMSEHPIKTFIEHGIDVSVNSDDPPMFNTDMNQEYITLHKDLGLTIQDLFNISRNSIKTSFLSDIEKERLNRIFMREYEKLTAS
jgi:adenosine deaminase